MRRRGDRRDDHGNHERWLVSYADFITLLFAFFTMLYAISTVDAQKLSKMVNSMQMAFDTNSRGGAQRPGVPMPLLTAAKLVSSPDRLPRGAQPQDAAPAAAPPPTPQAQVTAPAEAAPGAGGKGGTELSLVHVQERLRERLKDALSDGRIAVDLDRRGLVVSIREAGSFPTGSADLRPEARTVIEEVSKAVKDIGNAVRVEGHTDNVPIHTGPYPSNWELSTSRATTVVAFMIQTLGLDAGRLSAAGYSEFHPRVPNESEANRARNRRVDIVILNPATSQAEEPQGQPAAAR